MIHNTDYPTPYYAVIFASVKKENAEGYNEMADKLEELMADFEGFLGMDSARDESGKGITVCYWKDETSIINWKNQQDHQQAQIQGKADWYKDYSVRIARVEKAYSM